MPGRNALTLAGAVYVARWPIQIALFALALRAMRAGARRRAGAFALGGAIAVASPYVIMLFGGSWPPAAKWASTVAVVAVASGITARRLRRRNAALVRLGADDPAL